MIRVVVAILMLLPTYAATTLSAAADDFSCVESTPVPPATPVAGEWESVGFPSEGGQLVVFAAASLGDAFHEVADIIQAEYPNVEIVIQTAGSQTLVTQLGEGASADVLATANFATMERAQHADLIVGAPIAFTGNRLVLITPANNPADIQSLDDLAISGTSLVLANPEVPAGAYSRALLCAYAEIGDVPVDYLDLLQTNIVSEEPDVRHVLARIQLGEADAGIVYASDAVASQLAGVDVDIIELPADLPNSARYPIAAITGGNTDFANAFITFVLSDEGQAILQKYGFK